MPSSLYAVDAGFMDDIDLNKIGVFEGALLDYMNNSEVELMETLNGGDWNDDIKGQLNAACEEFKTTGSW